jgi:LuxR family maltose regulon positive regulatory protein
VTHALLATKLQPPPRRRQGVYRARLLRQLEQNLGRLNVVSAPAGYGKTTLLLDWLEQTPLRACWLSLDEADNDLKRFLRHLVAALQGAAQAPGVQAPANEALPEALTPVLNALAQPGPPVVLVLDDYHLIENEAVHEAVRFLLEHAPARLRLLVGSRVDPPLGLARWRARGELTELRAEALRFSRDEIRAFLEEVMGLALAPADLQTLERRSEGWIAGLQLAALSLKGRQDVSSFIERFTGTDRYVLDYLTEEVLMRQPPETQNFLMLTAVLDRLSGPLCQAVTGMADAQERLEQLERDNLFIVPLDSQRVWYRYHPFFRDLLLHRLERARPDLIPELTRRAKAWLAERQVVQCAELEPLSKREREVLRLIAAGLSNKEIARRLDITLNTVKTHAKRLHAKLGVKSRTQAGIKARERGLV